MFQKLPPCGLKKKLPLKDFVETVCAMLVKGWCTFERIESDEIVLRTDHEDCGPMYIAGTMMEINFVWEFLGLLVDKVDDSAKIVTKRSISVASPQFPHKGFMQRAMLLAILGVKSWQNPLYTRAMSLDIDIVYTIVELYLESEGSSTFAEALDLAA